MKLATSHVLPKRSGPVEQHVRDAESLGRHELAAPSNPGQVTSLLVVALAVLVAVAAINADLSVVIVAWTAATAATLALPFLVVRTVVAALER